MISSKKKSSSVDKKGVLSGVFITKIIELLFCISFLYLLINMCGGSDKIGLAP